MEAILASSPPTPQLSAHLHLRRPSLGFVRPTGHVVVRDEGSAQHLHNHAAEACFGEWAADAPPNHNEVDGLSARSPVTYELVLMPEEAIFLTCVAGCLEVAPDSKLSGASPRTCSTGGAAALGRLLELAVRADPTLTNLAQSHLGPDGELTAISDGRALAMRCALLRAVAYAHYRHSGYIVKDGVLLGCHFLLYRGAPSAVHSDYGVWVLDAECDRHYSRATAQLVSSRVHSKASSENADPLAVAKAPPHAPGTLTWQHIQALRRLLHDVAKKLLLCSVEGGGGYVGLPRIVDVSVG